MPTFIVYCLSHTLAGSDTPHSVSLFEVVLPVVSLVQFGHVLGDHVLILVVREWPRRRRGKAAVPCAPLRDPDRRGAQETVEHQQEQVRGHRAQSCHRSAEMSTESKEAKECGEKRSKVVFTDAPKQNNPKGGCA